MLTKETENNSQYARSCELFSEGLKEHRAFFGWSQERCAEELGLTRNSLRHMERGNPSRGSLIDALNHIYDHDVGEVFARYNADSFNELSKEHLMMELLNKFQEAEEDERADRHEAWWAGNEDLNPDCCDEDEIDGFYR